MTSEVVFRQVSFRNFRNIQALEFEPIPRLNVILGDNGQGKTSLLEALYVIATSKSFRAERIGEMIREGTDQAVLRARISDGALEREQRAALGQRSRALSIDGKRPERLSGYAVRTPVVVFHPGDLALVAGPAAGRRTLLDRVGLFVDVAGADARQRYLKALRERQRVLQERGPAAPELDVYEQLMSESGARFARARQRAAGALCAELTPAFARIASALLELGVSYQPGGCEDVEIFRRQLRQDRARDQRRNSASFGPQRDELELTLAGRSARRHASQGQQRILTLALKLAELGCIREARAAHPVLLLDDVSSELDPARTGAVFDFARESPSQVFVTTTRPELFPTPEIDSSARRDWVLRSGVLESAS